MFSAARGLLLASLTLTACCAVGAAGCGDSDSTGQADKAAVVQQQIEQARRDGATDARNNERIRQLEHEVREQKKAEQSRTVTQTVVAPTQPSEAATQGSSSTSGSSGWVAQLGSFTTSAAAQSQAERLSGQGLDVGVLDSNSYSPMRGGYWVVFAGFYTTRAGADGAVSSARADGVRDAFARYITPRST